MEGEGDEIVNREVHKVIGEFMPASQSIASAAGQFSSLCATNFLLVLDHGTVKSVLTITSR
jgi:hypothetical protein